MRAPEPGHLVEWTSRRRLRPPSDKAHRGLRVRRSASCARRRALGVCEHGPWSARFVSDRGPGAGAETVSARRPRRMRRVPPGPDSTGRPRVASLSSSDDVSPVCARADEVAGARRCRRDDRSPEASASWTAWHKVSAVPVWTRVQQAYRRASSSPSRSPSNGRLGIKVRIAPLWVPLRLLPSGCGPPTGMD